MDDLIYLEDARMWLTRHVREERQSLAMVAAGLVLVAAVAVLVGFWLLGPLIGLAGLVVITIAWLAGSRFTPERPVIRAETARPRLTGVPRMQNAVLYGPEFIENYIRVILACLLAPIHLPVEAFKMMKRRRRLLELEDSPAAEILAMIAERNGAWTFDELYERMGEERATLGLGALVDVEAVIWLQEPDRVALTDKAKDAIRAE